MARFRMTANKFLLLLCSLACFYSRTFAQEEGTTCCTTGNPEAPTEAPPQDSSEEPTVHEGSLKTDGDATPSDSEANAGDSPPSEAPVDSAESTAKPEIVTETTVTETGTTKKSWPQGGGGDGPLLVQNFDASKAGGMGAPSLVQNFS